MRRFGLFLITVTLNVAACAPHTSSEPVASTPSQRAVTAGAAISLRDQLDDKAPQWLAEADVPSLAVAYIRNGRLEWTRVYGEQEDGVPATTRTLYNIASLTKPLTAEVILRLVAAGHLSLYEPLSAHWIDPDIADDARHTKLTLRLALSHRTGFTNWRYQTGGVLRFDADPGSQFGYSGEGYEYGLRFVERKLGMPWESLATQYVFRPAGMTDVTGERRQHAAAAKRRS